MRTADNLLRKPASAKVDDWISEEGQPIRQSLEETMVGASRMVWNRIPVTESVGIAVLGVRAEPEGRVVAQPNDRTPSITEVTPTLYGTGVVMAMFEGEWVIFEDLGIANPQFKHLR